MFFRDIFDTISYDESGRLNSSTADAFVFLDVVDVWDVIVQHYVNNEREKLYHKRFSGRDHSVF